MKTADQWSDVSTVSPATFRGGGFRCSSINYVIQNIQLQVLIFLDSPRISIVPLSSAIKGDQTASIYSDNADNEIIFLKIVRKTSSILLLRDWLWDAFEPRFAGPENSSFTVAHCNARIDFYASALTTLLTRSNRQV
jgi:hypothetical protein